MPAATLHPIPARPASGPPRHRRTEAARASSCASPAPGDGVRTFANVPLSTSVLAPVARELQACCTGMLLVVLRELPGAELDGGCLRAGVYELALRQGRTRFSLLDTSPEVTWRILADPRPLTFASALLLPLQPPRSRRWFARAQVLAKQCGAAMTSVKTVVPALLVGVTPREEEVRLEKATAWPVFGAAAGASPAAPAGGREGFAFVAGPVALGPRRVYGTGRAADPRLALRKAEAEAWERQGWATLGPVSPGPMPEVRGAVDPRRFVAYSRSQYADAAFPFHPFTSQRHCLWTGGVDVLSGDAVALPAEYVHAASAIPGSHARALLTASTSSGVAAWTDAEGALSRATLELLERDAFLRCWVARKTPVNLRAEALPAEGRLRVQRLRSAGLRVRVAQIARAPVAVVSVFLQHRDAAFTAITAAADFRADEALARALGEAEGRAAHAAAYPQSPIENAEAVRSLPELLRMYQTRGFYQQADFYATGPQSAPLVDGMCKDWPALQDWIAARARRLLAFDLTPPGASLDQGRRPLRVMRAFVPGLLPIWFGRGLEPAGLPAFRRLLQRRGHTVTSSELLHPLA